MYRNIYYIYKLKYHWFRQQPYAVDNRESGTIPVAVESISVTNGYRIYNMFATGQIREGAVYRISQKTCHDTGS